jgi:hypothetical protein
MSPISPITPTVSTPLSMIGNEVIFWSHFTSYHKVSHDIYYYDFQISGIRKSFLFFYITFQLSDRSYMPLAAEAWVESLVCKIISKISQILNSDIKMKITEKFIWVKIFISITHHFKTHSFIILQSCVN